MKEAGREVALLDLNLKIGDVGVVLGLEARFTIMDALRNAERLDRDFVSTLMAHHSSGLAVLPASDAYVPSVSVDNSTLERLLGILREQFAYVVVDAGPSLGNQAEVLFQAADTIYLVSQVDIPSLRNAQRFIAHGLHAKSQQIEIVLNRFEPNKLGFDEQRISKALGMTPKWKIPNDFAAVRQSQNTGEPLIQRQSPVTRSLHQMARGACGKPLDDGKKKRRGLFG
jgi:pilus assembly protein CpaE